MPVMDGYQATQVIRQFEKNLVSSSSASPKITSSHYVNENRQYITGLSAHATEKFKQKAFEVQMDEFSKRSPTILTQYSDEAHRQEIASEGAEEGWTRQCLKILY